LKAGLAPVVAADTRLVILGSFPGVASLAAQQYYAHPRNRFWELVGAVIHVDLRAQAYEDRLASLRAHRVGVWDVIAEAEREGSLDSAIRDHAPNPLADLVDSLPQLRAVAFNGGTSSRIGRKQLAARQGSLALVDLPSSSPAYTLAFEDKRRAWLRLAHSLA
jgi:double-stranded uracil-DNA glycosylase